MSVENLFIQYREYRRDIKSFPPTSPMYKKAKLELKAFLADLRRKHGQQFVNNLVSKR